MTNKSGDIGTKTATAALNWFRANGFPDARKLVLHGRSDVGDIEVIPGRMIAEVKGGHAAENASDRQVIEWIKEAEREAENYAERYNEGIKVEAVLVVKRRGIGYSRAGDWWAVENVNYEGGIFPTWMRLKDFVQDFK